jgi:hypothetical protein
MARDSSMKVLNYTTTISADQTIGEIYSLLRKAGARNIIFDNDPQSQISRVGFEIKTSVDIQTFDMSINIGKAAKRLEQDYKDGKIQKQYSTEAQAERTSWRILLVYIEAVVNLIMLDLIDIAQVLTGFMLQGPVTVYQIMQAKYDDKQLIEGSEEVE